MGKKEGLRFDVVFRMTFTVILKYFLQGQYNHIWLRELNIYLKHFKFIWYKYDIWYKMLQKQCFSSHYCMEATGAPRNAYVFQKHIIYREQKLGPHGSLDTHFLIHQLHDVLLHVLGKIFSCSEIWKWMAKTQTVLCSSNFTSFKSQCKE